MDTLSLARRIGWIACLTAAIVFPLVDQNNYHVSIGVTALTVVVLAVSFDLVVGRIGALSLAQPLFFGLGAYAAAILSARYQTSFLLELAVAVSLALVAGVIIAIPSFRLDLHAFAIGTFGFALIGQVIAENWISVTNGPLCVTGVGPLTIGSWDFVDLRAQYYVVLGLAVVAVLIVAAIARSRIGLLLTAVRDDDTLAAARGISPTFLRVAVFTLAAGITASAGAFTAHYQMVICPSELGTQYSILLLLVVFIGGRASLRGVLTAAVLFTVLPQVLRMADEYRLAVFGLILLVIVIAVPDGLERGFALAERRLNGGKSKEKVDEPN